MSEMPENQPAPQPSPTKGLFKFALALGFIFVLIRLAEFGYSRLPPFEEGKCYIVKGQPLASVKVKENHILGGYSDVELRILYIRRDLKASFDEQREVMGEKVECEE